MIWYTVHIQILSVASLMLCMDIYFFPYPGSKPGSYSIFSCHISLVSFNLKQFLSLWRGVCMCVCVYMCFLTLTFFKSIGVLFCRMSFSSTKNFWYFHGREEFVNGSTTEVMLCSSQCIFMRRCILMVHSYIGDVNFDHFIKAVSARYGHYKFIVFPFVISK